MKIPTTKNFPSLSTIEKLGEILKIDLKPYYELEMEKDVIIFPELLYPFSSLLQNYIIPKSNYSFHYDRRIEGKENMEGVFYLMSVYKQMIHDQKNPHYAKESVETFMWTQANDGSVSEYWDNKIMPTQAELRKNNIRVYNTIFAYYEKSYASDIDPF